MPRAEPGHAGLLAVVGAIATVLLVSAAGQQPLRAAPPPAAVSWEGLVGGARANVDVGQRMIVVLKTPSLAERVAEQPSLVTPSREETWAGAVLSQEHLLLTRLALQGVSVQPEFNFARVLAGFSAQLDARALALVEADQSVQGVYPVRVAYPASISSTALTRKGLVQALGNASLELPGYDGRGVTIGLLDTGVDRSHPSLLGSVDDGIDVVTAGANASPKTAPGGQDLERHGTELAGILVGDHGPPGTNGVARGATVLPIRVAGWQPDAAGGYAVYARTDQVIEGLERAVDPNGDGDAEDAVKVALVGVVAPFAAFADDPVARAVGGALQLGTLVVAPAGNDGAAGPSFGSVGSPGGASDALTVGAADLRARTQRVQVSLRSGLRVVLARTLPLTSEVGPVRQIHGRIVAPGLLRPRSDLASLQSYFTKDGLSLVAGRVALVPAGNAPGAVARSAARAGAAAVILYGGGLPAGSIPLDEDIAVPVVAIPAAPAAHVLAALTAGSSTAAAIGPAADAPNADGATVAAFSSTGLAFDGRVKPDVVAPGVGVATTEPGTAEDGSPRYGTVSGTSAAAAAVAGAAAVLAQARPRLSAASLRSVLVGTARGLRGEAVSAEGAGLVALQRAAAAELATRPATLALGNVDGSDWTGTETLHVRNISTRRVTLRVDVERTTEGAAAMLFRAQPARFTLQPGTERTIEVAVGPASEPSGSAPSSGEVVLRPVGGSAVGVPWTVTFAPPESGLLGSVSLSARSFKPSDEAPALLRFRAGRVGNAGGLDDIEPVSALRLELFRANGQRLGTLVTLRDLLPGSYAFGITGRAPGGAKLPPGDYVVRVIAVPLRAGPPTVARVPFTIR